MEFYFGFIHHWDKILIGLLALGALPGTPFVVERVAPLGDPVEIKLRGSSISVRKGEIEILDVEPI